MQAIITSKGQITLPKYLRDKFNLRAGDRVEFICEEDDSIRLVTKYIPIRQLKGMLPKPQKPVSLEEMEQAIKTRAGHQ